MFWCVGILEAFLWFVLVNFFVVQAEDGIRGGRVTGVQTCALPIWSVLCSRVSRSSVPSSVPARRHGKEGGTHCSAVAHADGGARPAGLGAVPAGEGSSRK